MGVEWVDRGVCFAYKVATGGSLVMHALDGDAVDLVPVGCMDVIVMVSTVNLKYSE